jgi:hypothetical protein
VEAHPGLSLTFAHTRTYAPIREDGDVFVYGTPTLCRTGFHMGTLPYEPGPWTVVDGTICSANTNRPVAEVVREVHYAGSPESESVPQHVWRANERLIALAPELADSLRRVKMHLEAYGHSNNGIRDMIEEANRLLNGIGRLQVKHEVEQGTVYVRVLVTDRKCHIVLDDDKALCKRPLIKDAGTDFVRRVSWQAACELYDCPGCKAFMGFVEL